VFGVARGTRLPDGAGLAELFDPTAELAGAELVEVALTAGAELRSDEADAEAADEAEAVGLAAPEAAGLEALDDAAAEPDGALVGAATADAPPAAMAR